MPRITPDRNIWRALIHISHQIRCLEMKVITLIKQSQPDYSKEDRSILKLTKKVGEAEKRIPKPPKPKKGK